MPLAVDGGVGYRVTPVQDLVLSSLGLLLLSLTPSSYFLLHGLPPMMEGLLVVLRPIQWTALVIG